mgnify:CR=1 FL=1
MAPTCVQERSELSNNVFYHTALSAYPTRPQPCPWGAPTKGHGQGHCAWPLTSRSGGHWEVQPPHGEGTRHLPCPTRGLSRGPWTLGPAPSSTLQAVALRPLPVYFILFLVYFKFGILLKHLLDS